MKIENVPITDDGMTPAEKAGAIEFLGQARIAALTALHRIAKDYDLSMIAPIADIETAFKVAVGRVQNAADASEEF